MPKRTLASRRLPALLVRVLVVAFTLVGSITTASAVGAASVAGPRVPRCSAHRGDTLLSSRLVRVYEVKQRTYGCLRRSRRVRPLAGVFRRRSLAGSWVARIDYRFPEHGEETRSLVATDLRTGRTNREQLAVEPHDPDPDAIVVSTHGTLAWLERDTIPAFGSSGEFAAPPPDDDAPTAGDVDGDGVADRVTLLKHGVAIAPGQVDGTFGPRRRLSVPDGETAGVAVGDLDRDGHADVVVAVNFARDASDEPASRVWVFRGRGGFAFAPAVGTPPDSRDVLDAPRIVNAAGDGVPAVVDAPRGRAVVFCGNGDGTLAAPVEFGGHDDDLSDIVVADLNHDGISDVVGIENGDGGGVEVMLGRGGGRFARPVLIRAGLLSALALGDVDGDGNSDIVTAIQVGSGRRALVFEGHGDGTFKAPNGARDAVGAGSIALADVTGDDKLDVLTEGASAVVALPNRGDGSFVPARAGHDIDLKALHARSSHQLLGATRIDRGSLRFHGAKLTWTVAGKHASARVR